MKNIEKYEKEIRKYEGRFAVTKDGKVVNCMNYDCKDCLFCKGCAKLRMGWLLEEYKEPNLDDKGLTYIIELVAPFSVDDILSIVKIDVDSDKRYELKIDLVHAQMFVYFDRESMVGEMFANMKSNHCYSAEELGLC